MDLGALPLGDAAAAIGLAPCAAGPKEQAAAVAWICALSLPLLAEDVQKRLMALARKTTVLDDLLAEMVAQGKAAGRAEAILCVLARRFGAVGPGLADRIRGETSLPVLGELLVRAVDAPSLADFARSLAP